MSTSLGLCQKPFPLGNICFGHQPCPAHNTGNYGSYLNRRDLLTDDASFEGMKEPGNETFIDALRIWKEIPQGPLRLPVCLMGFLWKRWGLLYLLSLCMFESLVCVCVWQRDGEKEFACVVWCLLTVYLQTCSCGLLAAFVSPKVLSLLVPLSWLRDETVRFIPLQWLKV